MKRLLITICGRAGSKGFKNKNLKNFCGKPLVYYSLSAAELFIKKHPELEIDVALNTDSEDLARLVAALQPGLRLASLGFQPSGATRQKAENALIPAAMTAFEERARLSAQALGYSKWRIVEISLNGGGMPMPVQNLRFAQAASMADSMPDCMRQWQPASAFSMTDMFWNSRMVWNVRAMPRPTMVCGFMPLMDCPANRMSPPSGT